jgi:hypothetical protein
MLMLTLTCAAAWPGKNAVRQLTAMAEAQKKRFI